MFTSFGLNCISVSNKYTCACSHTWQNCTHKDAWVWQEKVVSVSVNLGVYGNFFSIITIGHLFTISVVEFWKTQILARTILIGGKEHKPLRAFQKHFNVREKIQNLSLSLTVSKQGK